MNLLDLAWIPVRGAPRRWLTLAEVTRVPADAIAAPRADLTCGLLECLVGLAQLALQPDDDLLIDLDDAPPPADAFSITGKPTSAASSAVREKPSNTGSRSCIACPILLMLSSLGWRSSPSGPNASSSKKHQVRDPLDRNSWLLARSCSSVVNTVRSPDGCHSCTISTARARSSAHASALANPSTARNPSRWYRSI